MALSTQPYKGARDFYPPDKRIQKYMFNTMRSVIEKYGYEEYDAPLLEPIEIYLAKTGDEIVNEQTYVFEDRGGRKVALRPEMTPTVSRMVAAKRQELAYPIRWYSIPNLWRYERPQRGRLREHWQLNVDIFGVASLAAEQEIITLVDDIFRTFGASPDMYEIRLNSRQLMDFALHEYLGLDTKQSHSVSKLIDRYHKLEKTDFIAAIDDLLTPAQKISGFTEKLLVVLQSRKISDLPEELRSFPATKELEKLLKSFEKAGISNLTFDASIMRGFDYYTDVVFEVFDTSPENNRSMMGGGRYDGLVGLFGVKEIPTVGFGWGDVTLANFLSIHNLLPDLKPETNLYVILVGEVHDKAQPTLAALRKANIKIAVDLSGRKVGDQIKTAEKKNIENVLIVGSEELDSNIFKMKNLKSGEESKYTVEELTNIFRK
jgi:histidyl-tRNA synthetase